MPSFEFVLAGRYKLVAPLGEGGMAAVYRGRDLRLNREVAIKILHDDLTRDRTYLARFEREAQTVASLSHPNIVPVYDVGEDGSARFIVMEYVRGKTLKEAIELQTKLAPERAVAVLLPVLDALEYAHNRGLIHRDVKPQNILISFDGTPRLADFGIAHLADASATRTAAILGSAHYLSPEQSRGEEASPRSDIYACGIVLYEMLTGKPPFDGSNALAIAHQHLHAPVPRILDPGAESLEGIVSLALEKDPEARFESANDFARSLREVPVAAAETTLQPLAQAQPPISPAVDPSANRDRPARYTVRRSTRKSYVLALVLAAAVAMAAYIAALPVWSGRLPAYPSLPYVILPAACAAVVLGSWLNTRSWIYTLDGSVAAVQWGLISHRRFGVPLRQVVTLELKQSPIERVLGVGTVEICARDHNGDERRLAMEDVPDPRRTFDELTHMLGHGGRPEDRVQEP